MFNCLLFWHDSGKYNNKISGNKYMQLSYIHCQFTYMNGFDPGLLIWQMCNYTVSMNTAYTINTKNSKIFYTFYYRLSLCSSSTRLFCFPALVHELMLCIKERSKFNHVEEPSNLIKFALLTTPQILAKLRYFKEKYTILLLICISIYNMLLLHFFQMTRPAK